MILDIIYIVLWGAMTLYCFFMAHKVHNVLYLASLFFAFMFGWTLVDFLLPIDMLSGLFGWIYKGISLLFLVVFVVIYIRIRKSKGNNN